jgi:hypothetical protein
MPMRLIDAIKECLDRRLDVYEIASRLHVDVELVRALVQQIIDGLT